MIFELQPEWCRKPLESKWINDDLIPRHPLKATKEHHTNILFFDPSELYERIQDILDPQIELLVKRRERSRRDREVMMITRTFNPIIHQQYR